MFVIYLQPLLLTQNNFSTPRGMSFFEIEIKEIEIAGEAVQSAIKGFPEYLSDIAINLLYTYEIEKPEEGKWYNFNNYLKALNEMGSTYGDDTLYAIGKQSIHCSSYPNDIKNLKDALERLEEAFELNHRNGKICWVTIEKFDLSEKRVEIFIENPYPFHLNRGVLTCIAREYNPIPNIIPEVSIDENLSIFSKGKYLITW